MKKIVSFFSDDAVFHGFEGGNIDDMTNYGEKWRRSFNGRMICYMQTDRGQKGSVNFQSKDFYRLF